MRRTSSLVTSVGLVVAVTVGVFASASFATGDLVSEKEQLYGDDVKPMAELKARGGVKSVVRDGERTYTLDFTAVFTPAADSEQGVGVDDGLPDLTMRQTISYPTLSGDQEFVGPVRLPFASESLGLDVHMAGECFEPQGRKGYVMKEFDPKCVQAFLSLGDRTFKVTDLFIDARSSVKPIGKDGASWMWKSTARFADPGYAFPIVSLGQDGSIEVLIGDMWAVADIGKVNFSGNS